MRQNLIYDVGVHRGEDTEFYLRRGFRVVGIEANPTLVARLQSRFALELASGQFTLVDRAIAERPGRARFTVFEGMPEWGTLYDEFADRNSALGEIGSVVEVECVTFEELLSSFGIPYYMKVDIEGADHLCLLALRKSRERPRYVSIESAVTSPGKSRGDVLAELTLLRELGYDAFKFVDQSFVPKMKDVALSREGLPGTFSFPQHASGPFGEETAGPWRSYRSARRRALLLHLYRDVLGSGGALTRTKFIHLIRCVRARVVGSYVSWYDLHARLGAR